MRDTGALPSSTIRSRFGKMGWTGTLFLSALGVVAFFYWLSIETAASTWVLELLQPTFHAISQELGGEYGRATVYLVSFMVFVALTFLFLLPIRYLISDSVKALVAGLVCIAPVTAMLLSMTFGEPNLWLWHTPVSLLAGLALFASMVLLRPLASAQR